jgi:type IV secretory pathway TraG/TraD family ATPase VirD4
MVNGRRPADWTDLATGAVVAALAIAGWLYVAAGVGCLLTSGHWLRGSWSEALGVIWNPSSPSAAFKDSAGVPGPFLFWMIAGLFLVAPSAIVLAGVGLWGRHRSSLQRRSRRLERLRGLAGAPEIEHAVGTRAVIRRGREARPQLEHAAPHEVGIRLGRSRGRACWASVEDSRILVGPPRSGKGLHQVIAAIIDAPGAVVTTSTRSDNFAATYALRHARGPIAAFDPQRLGDGTGVRWSPIRGCEDASTAMIRARGLAVGAGFTRGGVSESGFWQGQTEIVLRGLLHAAALDDAGVDRLYQWGLEPASSDEAVTILNRSPDSAVGWGDSLEGIVRMDSRTRDSIWAGVRAALSALADPAVREALSPAGGEGLDPARLLRESGTLYLLGTGAGAGASAAFIAALLEDVTETARHLASKQPGGRLEPPLAVILDEIANLCAVPSLPSLMADGGGSGISTLVVIQSLAQARDKWSEQAAAAMWDAATLRLILGGSAQPRDLQELSAVCGERDDEVRNWSRGSDGSRSVSASTRRVPILAQDVIRTLPFGTGVLLARTSPPIILRMQPWTARPDADEIRSAMTQALESGRS